MHLYLCNEYVNYSNIELNLFYIHILLLTLIKLNIIVVCLHFCNLCDHQIYLKKKLCIIIARIIQYWVYNINNKINIYITNDMMDEHIQAI